LSYQGLRVIEDDFKVLERELFSSLSPPNLYPCSIRVGTSYKGIEK